MIVGSHYLDDAIDSVSALTNTIFTLQVQVAACEVTDEKVEDRLEATMLALELGLSNLEFSNLRSTSLRLRRAHWQIHMAWGIGHQRWTLASFSWKMW